MHDAGTFPCVAGLTVDQSCTAYADLATSGDSGREKVPVAYIHFRPLGGDLSSVNEVGFRSMYEEVTQCATRRGLSVSPF